MTGSDTIITPNIACHINRVANCQTKLPLAENASRISPYGHMHDNIIQEEPISVAYARWQLISGTLK